MPPKKNKKERSKEESASILDPDYVRKLEFSNELEPSIREVVSSLMFTSGDDEAPFQENEDLVVNLIKNELILFFDDVLGVHENKLISVKLEHMLPLLTAQTGIIHRFVKYVKNRVEMAAFLKAKSYSNNGIENICGQEMDSDDDSKNDEQIEEGVDPIDELGEVGGTEGEYLKKKRRTFGTVTAEESLLEEVRKAFSDANMKFEYFENYKPDDTHKQQILALQAVIDRMDGEQYNRFAVARRVSFQSNSSVSTAFPVMSSKSESLKRKRANPKNNRQLLMLWLGNPPVHGELAQVFIAFLAKEIVSEIVGSALLERQMTNPAEVGPIRHCFYEEQLRKNKKFRKYGRLFI